MKKKYSTFILYILSFIYLEIINKILMFNKLPNYKFIIVILFSITASLFIYFINNFFKEKHQKIFNIIILILITGFYIFNYLYFSLLSVPFSVTTLELTGQAMDFYEIGFHLFITKIIDILLMLVPLVIYLLYQNKFNYTKKNIKNNLIYILLIIGFHLLSLLSLNIDKNDLYSAFNLYYKVSSTITSNDVLGVLTTQRLSLKRNIFGFEENIILEKEKENKNVEEEISYNKLDIDFDKLINEENDENIKNVYNYFKEKEPTKKNDYTGIYEGKNLIFILAEGFNEIAVDKALTPTLYKLTKEGFNFTNYYSPVFLSTTGGEFQAMTSLIPTQEILGDWRNNSPYLPFSIGNSFSSMGYNTYSFHNWSYKYYGRDKTMLSLGFTNYLACGNGLEQRINCKWIPSDVDLFNETIDDYAKNNPFATYYITVSGHAPYNFSGGNSIALKNKELVDNLPYSDAVKAYLASQIELDRALKSLIDNLKKNKILDDTVLVLTGDHYPYTLTIEEINEIAKVPKDEIIEVNHSNLIIWNNKKEGKAIEKTASQLDILPTILNLFDIPYDSRLLIGKDIFSDSEGISIFSNRSWVTDKGKYYVDKGFISNKDVSDSYIEEVNNQISNDFIISKYILKNNLYYKILNSEEN